MMQYRLHSSSLPPFTCIQLSSSVDNKARWVFRGEISLWLAPASFMILLGEEELEGLPKNGPVDKKSPAPAPVDQKSVGVVPAPVA